MKQFAGNEKALKMLRGEGKTWWLRKHTASWGILPHRDFLPKSFILRHFNTAIHFIYISTRVCVCACVCFPSEFHRSLHPFYRISQYMAGLELYIPRRLWYPIQKPSFQWPYRIVLCSITVHKHVSTHHINSRQPKGIKVLLRGTNIPHDVNWI
jgi:hypothetical protein